LKVRLAGFLSEDEWADLGLTLLSDDPDKTLILFADDAELTEFRRRVAAYQQPVPVQQKNPAYAGLVSAIDEIGQLTPSDRIGRVLRAEGLVNPEDFADNRIETLDVELWQPRPEMVQIFVHRLVAALDQAGGTVVSEYLGRAATLVRIRANGVAIRAVLELPEVAIVDRPPRPDLPEVEMPGLTIDDVPELRQPPDNAIAIGIIDSGISAAHPLLEPAVVASFGVPQELGDDDAKGHGTSVAGIAIYGDIRQHLGAGQLAPSFRIASAKVVNANGRFDDIMLVPSQMEQAIRRLRNDNGCRVVNISLGDQTRAVGDKPSAWAATLDDLARELDIVVIVSTGNRQDGLFQRFQDGVVGQYPKFLVDQWARILEPASAINAVTVGSLAAANGLTPEDAEYVGVRPLAERDEPSPFTLSGPGVGKMIKPDFVDYGGTAVFDGPTQALQDGGQRPAAGVLTLHHRYLERLFTSRSGTSFAAPLVAFKAASILQAFPEASANLVRVLLAIGARVPTPAAQRLADLENDAVWRICGNGHVDIEASNASEHNRVVLIREDALPVNRFAVFEVPIPQIFQSTRGRKRIRVALAFDPPVRHTRLDYAGLSMGFHLIRGADERAVFDHFRKWEAAEGQAFRLPERLKCSLEPGSQLRERGTLQCAAFVATQNIEQYGDRYFAVVRCEGGWAEAIVQEQRFAVAVEISHDAQIELYEQVVARVRVRA
jgi:subtilisin family serine protease